MDWQWSILKHYNRKKNFLIENVPFKTAKRIWKVFGWGSVEHMKIFSLHYFFFYLINQETKPKTQEKIAVSSENHMFMYHLFKLVFHRYKNIPEKNQFIIYSKNHIINNSYVWDLIMITARKLVSRLNKIRKRTTWCC